MEEKQTRECICRAGEPTNAAPGSPRKIRVLMERAARREPLFHPLDGVRRRPGTSAQASLPLPAPEPAVAPEAELTVELLEQADTPSELAG
jgi:hypothetical protein